MSRIKINKEGSWIYASTSKIPQIGVDYWNANDQQEMFGMLDSEVSGVSESVSFTLESNEGRDIIGLIVTFTNITTGETEEYTWDGSPIELRVTESHQYKFSCDGSSKLHESAETTTYTAVGSNNREVVLTLVYNPVTDLSMFNIYGTAILQTTANCYVIKEAGAYKFPLVYGNAIKNGATNSAAYTNNGGNYSMDFVNYNNVQITSPYIETDTGQTITSAEISMADTDGGLISLAVVSGTNCKYIQFTATSVPIVGANYVVSAKNSDDTILWSWHIWYWPNDLTVKTLTNNTDVNYEILPVNLATKLDSESALTSTTGWKNWFYQWGRHVPMLPPASYNSDTDHTNYGSETFTDEGSNNSSMNYGVGIQNPNVFYTSNVRSDNWFSSEIYYNLWDATCTAHGNSDNVVVKTIYDPSPIGFHIPNGNTFTYFSKDNIVGSFSNGWYFKRNSSDSTGVFFPASGFRSNSDSSPNNVGINGWYWLSSNEDYSISSYSKYNAYMLFFSHTSVSPQASGVRAYGHSVRCVKEQD